MEDKRQPYSEVLKSLEIPEDAPATKTCLCCGQPMHIVKVNQYFAYFIHTKEEQSACAEKNPTGLKLPMLWSNKLVIRKQLENYYEKVTGKKPEQPKFQNEVEVKNTDAPQTPR